MKAQRVLQDVTDDLNAEAEAQTLGGTSSPHRGGAARVSGARSDLISEYSRKIIFDGKVTERLHDFFWYRGWRPEECENKIGLGL